MGNAIQLNFDKQTTAKIKKLWTALKYHNICDFMVKNNVEPHITLFVFDQPLEGIEEELAAVVSDFFGQESSCEVRITGIGVLPGEANIVQLNLLVTEQLLALHHRLYDVMVDKGYGDRIIEKCRPGNWVPYITMTMNINETDMVDAIKLLKRKFKPMKTKVSSVSLLEFYPIRYKMNMELQ